MVKLYGIYTLYLALRFVFDSSLNGRFNFYFRWMKNSLKSNIVLKQGTFLDSF